MKHRKAVLRRVLAELAALCLCAVLLFGTAVPAFAAGAAVTVKVDDARLLQELAGGTNVSLRLYKIAGRSGGEWNYAEAPAFAGLAGQINAYELALQGGHTPGLSVLAAITGVIAGGGVTPVAEKSFSADGRVYLKIRNVNVELYADLKDPELEERLETVLDRHGIFYQKSEVWIEEEKLYEVLYQFETEDSNAEEKE